MIKIEDNEHIIMEIRKHWFIFFAEIAIGVIVMLLPIFVFAILEGLGLKVNLSSVSLGFFLYSVWLLIIWMIIFAFWTNYYLDVWIVTDQKIFDVEQKRIFSREVSLLHYENIQDITYSVDGILASLFNFGDIFVQTAGTEKNFTIRGVKNPEYIQKKINEILIKRHLNK